MKNWFQVLALAVLSISSSALIAGEHEQARSSSCSCTSRPSTNPTPPEDNQEAPAQEADQVTEEGAS